MQNFINSLQKDTQNFSKYAKKTLGSYKEFKKEVSKLGVTIKNDKRYWVGIAAVVFVLILIIASNKNFEGHVSFVSLSKNFSKAEWAQHGPLLKSIQASRRKIWLSDPVVVRNLNATRTPLSKNIQEALLSNFANNLKSEYTNISKWRGVKAILNAYAKLYSSFSGAGNKKNYPSYATVAHVFQYAQKKPGFFSK